MAAKPSKQVLGGREKVKVAIAQKSPAFMNRDASVARACAAIEEAGRNGAQLVVFPEAWLAGYPYWTEGWDSPLPQWTAYGATDRGAGASRRLLGPLRGACARFGGRRVRGLGLCRVKRSRRG
jgi:carbon-nitrogen hydrolase